MTGLKLGASKPLSGIGADVNLVPGEGWEVDTSNFVGAGVSGEAEGTGTELLCVGPTDGFGVRCASVGSPEGATVVRLESGITDGGDVNIFRIVGLRDTDEDGAGVPFETVGGIVIVSFEATGD